MSTVQEPEIGGLRGFYRKHFLGIELLFAVIVTLLFFYFGAGDFWLRKVDTVYIALAAAFGALLGFIITGISVVLAITEAPIFLPLRKSVVYRQIFAIFLSSSRFLGLGFMVALVGLVVPPDTVWSLMIGYLAVFVSVASALRVYRCVWVLDRMIQVITTEREKK